MIPIPDQVTEANLFKALFDTAPDAMIVVDHDGRIVLANPPAERLFGYGELELHGRQVEELLPQRVREAHQSHRANYMASPRVRPMGAGYELTGVRRNGQVFPVEIGLSPIRADGRALFAASIRDISETQRSRQALVRARYDAFVGQFSRLLLESPSYEAAVDSMPSLMAAALNTEAAAILFRDSHGRGWHCRASTGMGRALQKTICRDISGMSESVGPGKRELGVMGFDRMRDEFAKTHLALVDAGFVDAIMVPLLDRYEPMGLLLIMAKEPGSFDHDKAHFLQTVANILAAAVQRNRSEEKLSHAQRLDAIGQLTGGIAHDFNNLLTVISGNLQLLSAGLPDEQATQDAIDSAMRAADHCATLTGKLLSFASRRSLSPQAIRPAQLLAELKEMLRRTLGERIVVETTCPDDLPFIHVDASEFDAALVNLAVNARDAMPRGGRLDITARRVHDVSQDRTPSSPLREHIVFRIQDTGLGMSPETLAHALEPFFTTKDIGKGSGLGLSMVYGFVKQSGGTLTIESRLGYGTSVELSFPVAHADAAAPPQGPATSYQIGHETILVVEDEPEVRGVALAFLRSLGYTTYESNSADGALRILRAHPEIDLLFSDIVLGTGTTGVELAEAARQLRPGIPVLLTSGYAGLAQDVNEATLKQFELLPKPYRKEDLAGALDRALKAARAS
jgi:PAS domain S-box-containing protein